MEVREVKRSNAMASIDQAYCRTSLDVVIAIEFLEPLHRSAVPTPARHRNTANFDFILL